MLPDADALALALELELALELGPLAEALGPAELLRDTTLTLDELTEAELLEAPELPDDELLLDDDELLRSPQQQPPGSA